MSDYMKNMRTIIGHAPILQCGASVIVVNKSGEILLQRRCDNDCWGYHGGSVELDEVVEDAAKRELYEETGLIAESLELFGVFSGADMHYIYPNGDEVSNVDIVYICREWTGSLKPQASEVNDLRFFAPAQLPENISPPNVKPLSQYVEKLTKGLIKNGISIVYGTGNPAKLSSMRETLAPIGIHVVGLSETGIRIPDVDESGDSPLENARIKALAYYNVLKRPVFACDSGLYIDGLAEGEQPGVHVRVICGKRLNDQEMIDHYAGIAERLGGKALARYKNGICLIVGDGEVYEHFGDDISGEAFYLVSAPHPKRVEGYPLDSLSVHLGSGEYYYDRDGRSADTSMVSWRAGFRAFFLEHLHTNERV